MKSSHKNKQFNLHLHHLKYKHDYKRSTQYCATMREKSSRMTDLNYFFYLKVVLFEDKYQITTDEMIRLFNSGRLRWAGADIYLWRHYARCK